MVRFKTAEIVGRFALVMIAVVVSQGILAHRFGIARYVDLPLVCTVYYGFTLGNPVFSIILGSSLGLMQDSLSGAALGTNGFSKTLIAFLAASASAKFAVDQPITRILGLFLFTLADGVLVTMLNLMIAPAANATYSGTLGGWLLSAMMNTLLGLLLFGRHDRVNNATT